MITQWKIVLIIILFFSCTIVYFIIKKRLDYLTKSNSLKIWIELDWLKRENNKLKTLLKLIFLSIFITNCILILLTRL